MPPWCVRGGPPAGSHRPGGPGAAAPERQRKGTPHKGMVRAAAKRQHGPWRGVAASAPGPQVTSTRREVRPGDAKVLGHPMHIVPTDQDRPRPQAPCEQTAGGRHQHRRLSPWPPPSWSTAGPWAPWTTDRRGDRASPQRRLRGLAGRSPTLWDQGRRPARTEPWSQLGAPQDAHARPRGHWHPQAVKMPRRGGAAAPSLRATLARQGSSPVRAETGGTRGSGRRSRREPGPARRRGRRSTRPTARFAVSSSASRLYRHAWGITQSGRAPHRRR